MAWLICHLKWPIRHGSSLEHGEPGEISKEQYHDSTITHSERVQDGYVAAGDS